MDKITGQSFRIRKKSPDDLDLWSLPIDVEGEVPQEDPDHSSLDVIPQPSFPSPNYESESGSDVTMQDPYLSPRAEGSVEFSLLDMEGSMSRSPTDDLGHIFEEVDGNLGLPAGSHPFDAELHDFLTEGTTIKMEMNSSNDKASASGSDCEELDVTKEFDTQPQPVLTEPEPQTIIVKQKDGRNRVLSIIPISSECSITNSVAGKSITAGTLSISPSPDVRRSARTMKCVRQFRPDSVSVANPPRKKSGPIVPKDFKPKSMYPDESGFEELVDDKSKKNAIQAKMNREKKKAYIGSLESQVSDLTRENKTLSSNTSKLTRENDSLLQELEYLRSVIANQSALSKLLDNIPNVQNISLSTSFSKDRKRVAEDHDYGVLPKSRKTIASGGVCLHVANDNVSLEFCSSCAKMSKEREAEE